MMDEEYRCKRCRRLATEVHHIKPIQAKEGWELNEIKTNSIWWYNS